MGFLSTITAARKTAPNPELSGERMLWLPRSHLGGISVTPEEALRLSAVWACTTVTAKALASCVWDVFLERDNGDREPRRRVNAYSLLNMRPNPETTAFSFREAMYITAMIEGNFFAEIEFDRGGRPIALWPIATERCTLERESDNRLVVVVRNYRGGETVLEYDDVFHLHGPGIDGISGFDVVTTAARSLAHSAAAERFGQSFYHNGTQLGGLLTTAEKLSPDSRKETQEAIENGRKGSVDAFGLLVLDSGFNYTSFGVEPDKAQFIETRYLLIEEVCRWFGVPPHKIAHLLRSTFSNIEHQSIEFVRDALTPWAERARQEADWKLLRPWPGIRSRLDLEWLAEGDAKSKAEVDSIEVQNGLITRNEARRRRGRNSIGPDGDKLTLQVNMTTLDKIGVDPAPPQDAPQDTGAAALFRHAALRALDRRARVVKEWKDSDVVGDVFDAVRADDREQARYMGAVIGQCLRTLKVEGEPDGLREALSAFIEADAALMHDANTIETWCDMEARADALAKELSDLI